MDNRLLFGLLLVLTACAQATGGAGTTQTTQETPLTGTIHQTTLAIEGMTCAACAIGVESQLKGVDGVLSADVSWTKGTAVVTYDDGRTTPEEIARASTVYPATVAES